MNFPQFAVTVCMNGCIIAKGLLLYCTCSGTPPHIGCTRVKNKWAVSTRKLTGTIVMARLSLPVLH